MVYSLRTRQIRLRTPCRGSLPGRIFLALGRRAQTKLSSTAVLTDETRTALLAVRVEITAIRGRRA
jgi:hypothetical protein